MVTEPNPLAGARSIDVRSPTGVVEYSAIVTPVRPGANQSEPSVWRSIVKSRSVRDVLDTDPIFFVSSSRKRKPELSLRTLRAYTNAFRASNLGVSRRASL